MKEDESFNFQALGRKRYQYLFSIPSMNGEDNTIGTCWGIADARKFYYALAKELQGSVKVAVYRGVNMQVGHDIPKMFNQVMQSTSNNANSAN